MIIIDGLWSSVGSTNFDDRSFQLNDEINVGLLDARLAAQLRAAFIADLAHAPPAHVRRMAGPPALAQGRRRSGILGPVTVVSPVGSRRFAVGRGRGTRRRS